MYRDWAEAQSASRMNMRGDIFQGDIATGGWDPRSKPMRSGAAIGPHHQTLGDFLGAAGK